jgi:hypothetical protein
LQAGEQLIVGNAIQAAIALLVGALQPFKGLVFLAAPRNCAGGPVNPEYIK